MFGPIKQVEKSSQVKVLMRDIPSIQELPDYDGTPSGNLISFNALNNDLNGSYQPRGNTTLI